MYLFSALFSNVRLRPGWIVPLFWRVKTHFGKLVLKWYIFRHEKNVLIVWVICFCVRLFWNFNPSKVWNFNPSKAWNQLFVIVFRRVEISSFRRVEIKRKSRWFKLMYSKFLSMLYLKNAFKFSNSKNRFIFS